LKGLAQPERKSAARPRVAGARARGGWSSATISAAAWRFARTSDVVNFRRPFARQIDIPGAGHPRPSTDFAGRRSLKVWRWQFFGETSVRPLIGTTTGGATRCRAGDRAALLPSPVWERAAAGGGRVRGPRCGRRDSGGPRGAIHPRGTHLLRDARMARARAADSPRGRPAPRRKAPPPDIVIKRSRRVCFNSRQREGGLGRTVRAFGWRDFVFSESLCQAKAPPRAGVARERESRQSPRTPVREPLTSEPTIQVGTAELRANR
jgi:hypothetical protein